MLGFSGAAFAIQAEIPADTTAAIAKGGTQVTIGGEVRVRGYLLQNSKDFQKGVTDGSSGPAGSVGGGGNSSERMYYDQRVRLSVEAKTSPNTIGFIQMEAGGGDSYTGENYAWGKGGAKGLGGTYKQGDTKQDAFRVLQAWIQHSGSGLIGVPAYIKIGHQPITVGAGIFYKHTDYYDDAIVLGITPVKGLDLTALTVKLYEGLNLAADDQDLYSALITYAVNKDIVIGADLSLLQTQHGGIGGATTKSNLWNIGFNGKANVAGFALKASADFQTGDERYDGISGKYPFRGYAFTAGAAYTFAPVTLAVDLGYGSGDSRSDNKYGTFRTSQSDSVHWTFIYDYMMNNAAGNTCGGLQNTAFVQLSAKAQVVKDLNLSGSVTFLQAAKKVYGEAYNPSVTTSSRNLGTEVDLNASYQIDKGLLYYVEAGYLFAGNYWKGNASDLKLSDPWAIRHGIRLNF
jgi:hypothetical protein